MSIEKIKNNMLARASVKKEEVLKASSKEVPSSLDHEEKGGSEKKSAEDSMQLSSEAEILREIDFNNPQEEDLEKYRELVRLRANNGFYARFAAQAQQAASPNQKLQA